MAGKNTDTLQSTFDLFFGETENTAGTGVVTRAIGGVLADVIVNEKEHTEFHKAERAKADARNAKEAARNRAEAAYYSEEPVG